MPAADYVEVFLQDANLNFDRDYAYRVPAEFREVVQPGHCLLVPFGRGDRPREAFVFRCLTEEEFLAASPCPDSPSVKEFLSLRDPEPWLSEELLSLCSQMALRYTCARGKVASSMLPPRSSLKEKEQRFIALCDREAAGEALREMAFSSLQQVRVMELLTDYELPLTRQELLSLADCGPSVLKTLERKGFIEVLKTYTPPQLREGEIEDALDALTEAEKADLREKKQLTQEQSEVLAELIAAYEESRQESHRSETGKMNQAASGSSGKLREFLLHGVTGSGKTEVFLQFCSYLTERGEKVIVLVPEISLTPQMTQRFAARFEGRVALQHSRLRPYERLSLWRKIRNGEVDIALGPRSAVFAPFDRPALVIIDEEHEASYLNREQNPHYSALTVARLRQRAHGGLLLLASATPAVEDMYRCCQGKSVLLELKKRASGVELPEVQLIDLKKENPLTMQRGFSERLLSAMEECLSENGQIMLFLNRRGYAPVLVCSECGRSLHCTNCSVRMNYHRNENRLICHYCGHMRELPRVCPECGGRLILQGIGTEKLCESLARYFPEETILRMDSDSTRTRGSYERILERFRRKESRILVGTQMIAKGHDFPDLRLVGILGSDQIFARSDLRADERVFQLITQAAGRAGRSEERGRVLVETYDLKHYSIRAAAAQDYSSFYKAEIEMRRQWKKPPFYHYLSFYFSSADEPAAERAAKEAELILTAKLRACARHAPDLQWDVIPAAKSPINLLKNRYRWQLSLRANQERILVRLGRSFLQRKRNKEILLHAELDPA